MIDTKGRKAYVTLLTNERYLAGLVRRSPRSIDVLHEASRSLTLQYVPGSFCSTTP